jgi:putative transposase
VVRGKKADAVEGLLRERIPAAFGKRGDRFAGVEPIYDAVRERFGEVTPDVARGIAVRHERGPQYASGHFQRALRWLGIEASPAFAGELPYNGCADRFIRTLKEQCLWARTYVDLDDLRTAVRAFVARYDTQWLTCSSPEIQRSEEVTGEPHIQGCGV